MKNKGFRAIAGDLNVQGQEIKEFENDEVALPLISGSVKFPDNEGFFRFFFFFLFLGIRSPGLL